MLDSLQHHVKFILTFILLISSASAYEMRATPAEIFIETDIGEKVCTEIEIEADSQDLTINTFWSPKKSRSIMDFTYTPNEIGLIVSSPERFTSRRGDFEVCVRPEEEYAYYGVIAIEDLSKSAGIGVWITLNSHFPDRTDLEPEEPKPNTQSIPRTRQKLTGSTIADTFDTSLQIQDYLIFSSLFLAIALTFLFVRFRRKKRA